MSHLPAARVPKTMIAACGLWCALATPTGGYSQATPRNNEPIQERGADFFIEAAQATGLDFRHNHGATGELYFPEIMGAGVALFDYDDDGDLDVYLVQGGWVNPDKADPSTGQDAVDRLFRNDLESRADGSRRLRFVDVTERSAIRASGYGMGVAVGDYDHNGRQDLYLTNFGSNQLWRNDGDGSFSERTREAGVDDPRWSVPAVFFDFDNDRWPDLWVGNYTDYRLATHKRCFSPSGHRDYCAPASYRPEPDRLFRNQRNGTFTEVTLASGLASEYGYALGGSAADFNADGRLDLYVANDGVANQLWLNKGDGTFQNDALLAGCAVNAKGEPEASMGVAVGDFDGDGDPDLFLTHLAKESNTLYVNEGSSGFEDRTTTSGLAEPSWPFTSFGTAWIDFDNNGLLDLLMANGAVYVLPELVAAGDPYPFHQTNQLFRNLGKGLFEEVTDIAGTAFKESEVSRGAAFGDLDNDGDTDVVISNINGPVHLLINQAANNTHWVGLRLSDADGNLVQDGAKAALYQAPGAPTYRAVQVAGSYAAANDPRILFGLGREMSGKTIEAVEVYWPGGRREIWRQLPIDTYSELREGTGELLSSTKE